MAEQVKFTIVADAEQAQAVIKDSQRALEAFAGTIRSTNTTAVNAFRSEAEAHRELLSQLNAGTEEWQNYEKTVQRVDAAVNSAQMRQARGLQTAARGFAVLATSTGANVRSVDQLIGSMSYLVLGFTGPAGIVGAVAIATYAVARFFGNMDAEADKAAEKLRRLKFDGSFSAAYAQDKDLEFRISEAQRKLALAQQALKVEDAATMSGGMRSPMGAGEYLAAALKVHSAEKALNELVKERADLQPTLVDLAKQEGDAQRVQWEYEQETRKEEEKRLAARHALTAAAQRERQEAELARRDAENAARLAKHDAPTITHDVLSTQGMSIDARSAELNKAVLADIAQIGANAQYAIRKLAGPGKSTSLMSQLFPSTTEFEQQRQEWNKLFTMVSGQGVQSFRLLTQAMQAHGIAGATIAKGVAETIHRVQMVAEAAYDIQMAKRAWADGMLALAKHDPIGAALAFTASAGYVAAAAVAGIGAVAGDGGSGGGSGGGSAGGANSADAARHSASGTTQTAPPLTIVVTGDLKMDNRHVASLRGRIQRLDDRRVPLRVGV